MRLAIYVFFFFNDTATTEIYTLSLHDALPIFAQRAERQSCTSPRPVLRRHINGTHGTAQRRAPGQRLLDRKSTRLNSSHANISYAVFCLKKKKNTYMLLLHIFRTILTASSLLR